MIKIIVDTEDEISTVREIIKDQVCDRCSCPPVWMGTTISCPPCVEEYCEGRIQLYKKEYVEEPVRIMV